MLQESLKFMTYMKSKEISNKGEHCETSPSLKYNQKWTTTTKLGFTLDL